MRKLIIRLQAQHDIEAAAVWYENQCSVLGTEFLEEVDYVMSRITRSPFQFPEIHPGIRRGLLNRFPYSVYFCAIEERIEIIALLHQHRHPDIWRDRL
jgi:toxin ParE1/3/4